MRRQLGFLIDLDKCIGCKGCQLACCNEHRLGEVPRRRVSTLTDDSNSAFGFLSMACNHCSNPACIAVCPNKCYNKRRDGIVIHDPIHCNGCKSCTAACPFSAPNFNEKNNKIDKCNFCQERQGEGMKPACISACIPEALQLIDLSDPVINKYQRVLPSFKMVYITNPAVRFILPQIPKCFWLLSLEVSVGVT